MKKRIAVWTVAFAALASAGSLLAHHSLAQYDTTTAVRVKGTVALFQRVNPHSIIFIDQKGPNGETQRWAVEGPPVPQLERRGFTREALKVGDVIEACGYVTKDHRDRTVDTEPISLSLKATTPKSVSGRLMDGELLTMPDGKQQVWSDYGFHKCMAPDYQDIHGVR